MTDVPTNLPLDLIAQLQHQYAQSLVILLDQKGNIVYQNQTAEQELGAIAHIERAIPSLASSIAWVSFWNQVRSKAVLDSCFDLVCDGGNKSIQCQCRFVESGPSVLIEGIFMPNLSDELAQSALYKRIVASSSDLVAYVNQELGLELVNPSFSRFFNIGEFIAGMTIAKVFDERVFQDHILPRLQLSLKGSICTHQFWVSNIKGRRCLEITYTPFTEQRGDISGVVLDARDITERVLAEQARALASKVFDNAAEAILIEDDKQRIVSVNQAFCQITGYQKTEVVGRTGLLLNSAKNDPALRRKMWRELNRDGVWRGEVWGQRKDGSDFPGWLSVAAVRDGERDRVTKYVSLFSDLTHKKRSEERIWRQANFDSLTGIANRQRFELHLEKAMSEQQACVLLFIEFDSFKATNDRYGHSVGDQLLRDIALRLLASVQPNDVCARFGGAEFAIMLTSPESISQQTNICLQLLDRIAQVFVVDNKNLFLSCHIGIAQAYTDALTAADLVDKAYMAMNQAKAQQHSRFLRYSAELESHAKLKLNFENELRRGLKQQEFELAFQPILAMSSQQLIATEALIRWRHPERGLLGAIDFLEQVEDANMLHPLNEWMCQQAIEQYHQWQQQGLEVGRLALNIAHLQLKDLGFFHFLQGLLEQYAIRPEQLILEVTEQFIINSSNEIIAQFTRLQQQGLLLALDDYGRGYASLHYLKKFPLNIIKLERVFIKDIESSEVDLLLAESSIQLANKLGLTIVAEGVETQPHYDLLRKLGCDWMQGYFVSPPETAADFETWLAGFQTKPA
ncbi:sensor domain-containing protein [Motilimonas eburnea]|uniref:sensor domain-containing protein n=1 Tax=Motilimonas eburnea TaxID=1737488 RepID=UPI001E530367|nr:bifunctional diguanylate cyclase/phosphodiesterase [Motilimonas eburnea]MCE2573589.1 EAL domain-containing protein [Motilimonas eburnea]